MQEFFQEIFGYVKLKDVWQSQEVETMTTNYGKILTIKQKCNALCHLKEVPPNFNKFCSCKGTGQLETEIYALNDFEIAETITKLNKRGVK